MKPVLVLFVFSHCFVEHVIGAIHPKYNCYGRPNEQFTNSYNPTCESLCEDGPGPQACPAVHTGVEGCFCKSGYYRNSQGICVEYSQCDTSPEPQQQPQPREDDPCRTWRYPNEMFTTDFRPDCEPTCDEPQKVCTTEPVYRGCTCKEGFVRDKVVVSHSTFNICIEPWRCRPASHAPPTPEWNLPQPWQPWQQHQQLLQWLQSQQMPKLPPRRIFARDALKMQLEQAETDGGAEEVWN